jgi:uncharacterized protein YegP (UPF0339 family)
MGDPDYYDIYNGPNNKWYWNLHNGSNHAIIATGGEGFESRRNTYDSIVWFREQVKTAYLPSAYKASMATDDLIADTDTEDHNDRKTM